MPTILTVDDDRSVQHLIHRTLEGREFEVVAVSSAKEALATIESTPPDVVLLEVVLPDASGLELVGKMKEIDPQLPSIVVTAIDSSDTAIEAIRLGAFDYLPKPIEVDRLECMVEQALESRRLMTTVSMDDMLTPTEQGDTLVGRCEAMQQVFKAIGRVTGEEVAVLIRGESGTGKELVARAIFQHGKRTGGRFLAVNCAALTETLLESELFGHEKGSFTGAHSRRIGKFEQCDGGTILLDEIGDMSPSVQGKVLRILQEQKFERVGGNETIETDVRLISATNRNLEQMCHDGDFREDLFYRLNGYTIDLPPLRERGDDLVLLIEHFLARIARKLDKKVTGIAPEAKVALLDHHWPGNVRELESVLRRAILFSSESVLLEASLPKSVFGKSEDASGNSDPAPGDGLAHFIEKRIDEQTDELYAETLAEMEKQLLTIVLRSTKGNQSEASRVLGITRGSLRNKIRTLGISIDQVVSVDGGSSNDDCDACEDSSEAGENKESDAKDGPPEPC